MFLLAIVVAMVEIGEFRFWIGLGERSLRGWNLRCLRW